MERSTQIKDMVKYVINNKDAFDCEAEARKFIERNNLKNYTLHLCYHDEGNTRPCEMIEDTTIKEVR